jgi:hypothetical protein
MTDKDPASQSQRRVIQYWYVDGTFEFSMGGLCLLLAAYFYFQNLLNGTLIGEMLVPFFILIVIGGGWLINRLVMRMKERLTFPRTGYVSFRREDGLKGRMRIAIGGGVAMLVSAFLGWLVIHEPANMSWMPAISGAGFGLAIGIFAWRTSLPRFYALAVISLALGIALSMLGLEQWLGVTLYYLGLGVILVSVGARVLGNYLRQHAVSDEEKEL